VQYSVPWLVKMVALIKYSVFFNSECDRNYASVNRLCVSLASRPTTKSTTSMFRCTTLP